MTDYVRRERRREGGREGTVGAPGWQPMGVLDLGVGSASPEGLG